MVYTGTDINFENYIFLDDSRENEEFFEHLMDVQNRKESILQTIFASKTNSKRTKNSKICLPMNRHYIRIRDSKHPRNRKPNKRYTENSVYQKMLMGGKRKPNAKR